MAKDNGVRWKCADMEQRLDVVLKMHDMQKSHALWNSQWSSRELAENPLKIHAANSKEKKIMSLTLLFSF